MIGDLLVGIWKIIYLFVSREVHKWQSGADLLYDLQQGLCLVEDQYCVCIHDFVSYSELKSGNRHFVAFGLEYG